MAQFRRFPASCVFPDSCVTKKASWLFMLTSVVTLTEALQRDLLARMLDADAATRCTVVELLAHPCTQGCTLQTPELSHDCVASSTNTARGAQRSKSTGGPAVSNVKENMMLDASCNAQAPLASGLMTRQQLAEESSVGDVVQSAAQTLLVSTSAVHCHRLCVTHVLAASQSSLHRQRIFEHCTHLHKVCRANALSVVDF